VIEYKLTGVKITTFSTIDREGGCNVTEFSKNTAASIAAQVQTFMKPRLIRKSGVHTLVMSKDLTPAMNPYVEIGANQFRNDSTINIDYLSYFYHYFTESKYRNGFINESFTPLKASAEIFFLYNPGLSVYELQSPAGKIFTMISFTNHINPNLNLDNLKELKDLLNLPSGWSFTSRVLEKELTVTATAPMDKVEYIFDNFGNYYIRTQ
jgi:hypothetical protein